MATKCKKEDYEPPKNAKFECKNCHRQAKNKDKLCKPGKL